MIDDHPEEGGASGGFLDIVTEVPVGTTAVASGEGIDFMGFAARRAWAGAIAVVIAAGFAGLLVASPAAAGAPIPPYICPPPGGGGSGGSGGGDWGFGFVPGDVHAEGSDWVVPESGGLAPPLGTPPIGPGNYFYLVGATPTFFTNGPEGTWPGGFADRSWQGGSGGAAWDGPVLIEDLSSLETGLLGVLIPDDATPGDIELVGFEGPGPTGSRVTITIATAAIWNDSVISVNEAASTLVPGGAVVAAGSGFAPGETVDVVLAGLGCSGSIGTYLANDEGHVSGSLEIPASVPGGTSYLIAQGRTSGKQAAVAIVISTISVTTGESSGLVPGATIQVEADGFQSGESVEVVLHSTPVVLGTLIASPTGHISGSFTIPSSTPSGAHTIVATGLTSGFSISAGITILLAATGEDPTAAAALAAALVVGGALLLLTRRRRKDA